MYISVDGDNFIHYADLEKKNKELWIQAYKTELKTNAEIEFVNKYINFSNNEKIKGMKKIFISYSKYDDDYKVEFVKHTVVMQTQKLIDKPFDDGQIEFGVECDEKIKQEISNCDIMVCLVSIDFLNTDYIQRVEITEALKEGKMLVPIVIKPCDWENSEIAKYQFASKGQCISLNYEYGLKNIIRENTDVEKAAFWTKIIKEMRDKIFKTK
jgi:internalin A